MPEIDWRGELERIEGGVRDTLREALSCAEDEAGGEWTDAVVVLFRSSGPDGKADEMSYLVTAGTSCERTLWMAEHLRMALLRPEE